MPNVKIWVDGKTIAFVAGSDGVKNAFIGDNGEIVLLLDDGIQTFSGFPFVLERDYKKEDKKS